MSHSDHQWLCGSKEYKATFLSKNAQVQMSLVVCLMLYAWMGRTSDSSRSGGGFAWGGGFRKGRWSWLAKMNSKPTCWTFVRERWRLRTSGFGGRCRLDAHDSLSIARSRHGRETGGAEETDGVAHSGDAIGWTERGPSVAQAAALASSNGRSDQGYAANPPRA